MLLAGLLVAALPAGSRALDDCGPPVGDLVICDAANEVDSYQNADGITYTTTDLTIQHPGDGTPTEFISSGGNGNFGDLSIFSSGPVQQTAVSAGTAPAGIYAESRDGGITITTTVGGTVSTESEGADGISATSGGSGADGAVTVLAQDAVSTLGDGARGIFAYSAGGAVSVTSQAVSTEGGSASGFTSVGIFAISDGSGADGAVTVRAEGAVSTLSDGAIGIFARSLGGAIDVTSQAVSTEGNDAFGILAASGGAVTVLAQGAVSTLGTGAVGISAAGVGADGAVTVQANGSISTLGVGAAGISATSAGGPLQVTSQAISTEGDGAFGIVGTTLGAGLDGTLIVRANGAVSALGTAVVGIRAYGADGPVDVMATSVTASGAASLAVSAVSGTQGVTVQLDSAQGGFGGGIGVFFGSSTAGVGSTLTVRSGGSIGALSDFAVAAGIGDETVLLSGHAVGQMSFDDGDDALRILPGGQYVLRNFADTDGDGVRDTIGDALLDLGAGANDQVLVQGNGLLALGIAAGDDVGRIVGAENFVNAGVVSLADQSVGAAAPDAGDRLWTDGPYQGSGGLLRLDARLDAGGPGLQLTDRFLVDGDVTGTTGVRVYNDLGQGAPTGGGSTAGISIVQVAGTAASDSFALAQPLTAGAWEYQIVAFDPGSSDAGEKDPLLGGGAFWDYRLQSSLFTGVYEYAALMQGPGLLGQAALEGALNRPDAPPAIAAPGGDQRAALGAGDLQEAVRPTAGDGVATGAWLAAFGQGLEVSAGNRLTFGQDNYGLSAGYDLAGWRGVFGGEDSLVLGAFGTLAEGSVSFNGSASTLDISLWGGGAYAAYGDGGFRADLVAQVLTGDADYVAPYPSVDSSLDVTTLGLGAGASWRFDLGRVFVTPGAELRYVHAWGEDFEDGSDVTIGLDDTDSLVARGRVKAGLGFDSVAPYLSVGVAHEFLGEASATASGLTFNSSVEGTAFEVGGGLTAWALASNLSLTLDAGYRFGDEVEGFSVTGGFKLSW